MTELHHGRLLMCSRCGVAQPHKPENFRLVEETRAGKAYRYVKRICRPCEYKARVAYGRLNRLKQNAQRRRKASYEKYRKDNLKKNFGLSLEGYDALLSAQGGKCRICGTTKNERHHTGRAIPLSVDHCHATGKVRALLCGSCNRGLGDFRDRPDLLIAAAQYLTEHKDG